NRLENKCRTRRGDRARQHSRSSFAIHIEPNRGRAVRQTKGIVARDEVFRLIQCAVAYHLRRACDGRRRGNRRRIYCQLAKPRGCDDTRDERSRNETARDGVEFHCFPSVESLVRRSRARPATKTSMRRASAFEAAAPGSGCATASSRTANGVAPPSIARRKLARPTTSVTPTRRTATSRSELVALLSARSCMPVILKPTESARSSSSDARADAA